MLPKRRMARIIFLVRSSLGALIFYVLPKEDLVSVCYKQSSSSHAVLSRVADRLPRRALTLGSVQRGGEVRRESTRLFSNSSAEVATSRAKIAVSKSISGLYGIF